MIRTHKRGESSDVVPIDRSDELFEIFSRVIRGCAVVHFFIFSTSTKSSFGQRGQQRHRPNP
jgi:hypothetical protein